MMRLAFNYLGLHHLVDLLITQLLKFKDRLEVEHMEQKEESATRLCAGLE
jgi:hypothetical protein